MVNIKIEQPPLLDISKKRVKRATNKQPWSYSGYAPPSSTLHFKLEKIKASQKQLTSESTVRVTERVMSGKHYFKDYEEIVESEKVSSADEALQNEDLKLALKKIVKKMPHHRYNRSDLKPPSISKHFLGNKYQNLKKKVFKEDGVPQAPPSTAPTGVTRRPQVPGQDNLYSEKQTIVSPLFSPKSEGGGVGRQSLDYRMQKLKDIEKALIQSDVQEREDRREKDRLRQRDAYLVSVQAMRRSKEIASFSELGKISSVKQMLGPLFDGEKVRLPELDMDDEYKRLMISKFHPSSHKHEFRVYKEKEKLAKLKPKGSIKIDEDSTALEQFSIFKRQEQQKPWTTETSRRKYKVSSPSSGILSKSSIMSHKEKGPISSQTFIAPGIGARLMNKVLEGRDLMITSSSFKIHQTTDSDIKIFPPMNSQPVDLSSPPPQISTPPSMPSSIKQSAVRTKQNREIGANFEFSPPPRIPLTLMSPKFKEREVGGALGFKRPSLEQMRYQMKQQESLRQLQLTPDRESFPLPTQTVSSLRGSYDRQRSLAHQLLTFHRRLGSSPPKKTRYQRTGGGGMQTQKGLAFMARNFSDSELSPNDSGIDTSRKPKEIYQMKVQIQQKKKEQEQPPKQEEEKRISSKFTHYHSDPEDAKEKLRTRHKSFVSGRFKRFPRFTVLYRQGRKEEEEISPSEVKKTIQSGKQSIGPQEAIYINLSPHLIQQLVEQQQSIPLKTEMSGQSPRNPEVASISKQLTMGNLSTESKEMILATSKIPPKLKEIDSGSPLSSARRAKESARSIDDDCLKVFDPFERVLLTSTGGIDNAMITSQRTIKRQNNMVSPYSFKIIHSNFAPHALSPTKKVTQQLNKKLRSLECRVTSPPKSTLAIASGYLSEPDYVSVPLKEQIAQGAEGNALWQIFMSGAIQSNSQLPRQISPRLMTEPQHPIKQQITSKLADPSLPTFGAHTDRSDPLASESSFGILGPLNVSHQSLLKAPRKSMQNLRSVKNTPSKHFSHPTLPLYQKRESRRSSPKRIEGKHREEVALSAPRLPDMVYIPHQPTSQVVAKQRVDSRDFELSQLEEAAMKAATTAAKKRHKREEYKVKLVRPFNVRQTPSEVERLVKPIYNAPRVITGFIPRVMPQIMHQKSLAKEAVNRLKEKHQLRKEQDQRLRISLEQFQRFSFPMASQQYSMDIKGTPSKLEGSIEQPSIGLDQALGVSIGNDTLAYESLSQITSVPALQPRPLSSTLRAQQLKDQVQVSQSKGHIKKIEREGKRAAAVVRRDSQDYEKRRKSPIEVRNEDFVWHKAKQASISKMGVLGERVSERRASSQRAKSRGQKS